jgi:membrane protein implicated in regulation of membrane protease activity
MSPVAIWLVAGLVLCAAEMLAPGVFLLWIGLAACGTGAIAAAFSMSWEGQLALFVGLTVVLIGLAAWRLRRQPARDVVNAPAAGLIGATCHALAFQAGEGRVSLRDGTWAARVADASTPASGDVLRVVGLDGTTLLVEKHPQGAQAAFGP